MHDTIRAYKECDVEYWDEEEEGDPPVEELLHDVEETWQFILVLAEHARPSLGDEAVDEALARCERWYRNTRQRLFDDLRLECEMMSDEVVRQRRIP